MKHAWCGRAAIAAITAVAGHGASAAMAAAVDADTGSTAGTVASAGGLLQVMLGLGLVLAVMAGLAWLLRRLQERQRNPGGTIRVIGGSAVGQRERVVLVEISDTWLVLGVAPGQVTALHSMPKGGPGLDPASSHPGTDGRFAAWLGRSTQKAEGGRDGE